MECFVTHVKGREFKSKMYIHSPTACSKEFCRFLHGWFYCYILLFTPQPFYCLSMIIPRPVYIPSTCKLLLTRCLWTVNKIVLFAWTLKCWCLPILVQSAVCTRWNGDTVCWILGMHAGKWPVETPEMWLHPLIHCRPILSSSREVALTFKPARSIYKIKFS